MASDNQRQVHIQREPHAVIEETSKATSLDLYKEFEFQIRENGFVLLRGGPATIPQSFDLKVSSYSYGGRKVLEDGLMEERVTENGKKVFKISPKNYPTPGELTDDAIYNLLTTTERSDYRIADTVDKEKIKVPSSSDFDCGQVNVPRFPGVTVSQLYIGDYAAATLAHREEGGLPSQCTLFAGGCKIWLIINPSCVGSFESAVAERKNEKSRCSQGIRHWCIWAEPAWLDRHKIKYKIIVMRPGDSVIVGGDVYHQVINHGPNLARSHNIIPSPPSWNINGVQFCDREECGFDLIKMTDMNALMSAVAEPDAPVRQVDSVATAGKRKPTGPTQKKARKRSRQGPSDTSQSTSFTMPLPSGDPKVISSRWLSNEDRKVINQSRGYSVKALLVDLVESFMRDLYDYIRGDEAQFQSEPLDSKSHLAWWIHRLPGLLFLADVEEKVKDIKHLPIEEQKRVMHILFAEMKFESKRDAFMLWESIISTWDSTVEYMFARNALDDGGWSRKRTLQEWWGAVEPKAFEQVFGL